MNRISPPVSALFTDLYELTMMQVWFSQNTHTRRACFDLFFRENPFNGGYSVVCGIDDAIVFLTEARFTPEDIRYLASLGLFDESFLSWLSSWKFDGTVHGMAEGSLAFPNEPVMRIEGSIASCQLVETALLNILNFQSLIATKASRISGVIGWDLVMEFGARRAQGPDGAFSAARAAYIGGCSGTSNVLAGKELGIPVKGTHAHSFVMAASSEVEAFRQFVACYPDGAVLLIDTYDTLGSGLPHAIMVAREMEERGQRLFGIRLDSGDILTLSRRCREILDGEDLSYVRIICSGDLDEYHLAKLRDAGAPVDGAGIGTRLVTGNESPAMTGVYKLAAIAGDDGTIRPVLKLTDQTAKQTLPGVKQVYRTFDTDGMMAGDCIDLAHPETGIVPETLNPGKIVPLLQPLMVSGSPVRPGRTIHEIRNTLRSALQLLPGQYLRIEQPATYPCTIGPNLTRVRDQVSHSHQISSPDT